MSIYGYCRISSKKQLEGYGLEAQEQEILDKYRNVNITILKEQYSGKTTDRPIFNNIFESLKSGYMLIVAKLDRLARNTVEGIQIIQDLFSKNVSVHVLNVGLLENTTMGKFFITTLLAVAEMERNTILERTQAGKEIAKLNPNFKEGRPRKFTNTQLDMALDLLSKHSYTEVESMTQISKSTLVRAMKMRKLSQDRSCDSNV